MDLMKALILSLFDRLVQNLKVVDQRKITLSIDMAKQLSMIDKKEVTHR